MKVEYTNLFMQAFDDLVSCGHHFKGYLLALLVPEFHFNIV